MADTDRIPRSKHSFSRNFDYSSLDFLQRRQQKLIDATGLAKPDSRIDPYLPSRLVVCGDYFPWKSSLLQYVTGIPFPHYRGMPTRFATEIVCRRSVNEKVSVRIIPDHDRSPSEKITLSRFGQNVGHFTLDGFSSVISDAGRAIRVVPSTKSEIFGDVLQIEISGPDKPQLTIVDLPDYIHSFEKFEDRVRSLCWKYIADPRTIILAVIPNRYRTIGIITEPVTLYPGTNLECEDVSLAMGAGIGIGFPVPCHILNSASAEIPTVVTAERILVDIDFIKQGIWKWSPKNVVSLRLRLSRLLLDQTKNVIIARRLADSLNISAMARGALQWMSSFIVNQHLSYTLKYWSENVCRLAKDSHSLSARELSVLKSIGNKHTRDAIAAKIREFSAPVTDNLSSKGPPSFQNLHPSTVDNDVHFPPEAPELFSKPEHPGIHVDSGSASDFEFSKSGCSDDLEGEDESSEVQSIVGVINYLTSEKVVEMYTTAIVNSFTPVLMAQRNESLLMILTEYGLLRPF
ncbi:hypothetical protein Q9L58_006995 [Maublancomyces gigas]|uniref:Dynamin N-terminal domain-containing protein n=1 Tax=Discina gigas TaxID=1032678 RepID=A0ABR3GDS0_9PEZI